MARGASAKVGVEPARGTAASDAGFRADAIRRGWEYGRAYFELFSPRYILFHRNLLRNAGGVLGVSFRHGTVIHGLAAWRADILAQVEDMRRRGCFGAILRSNPVHDILTSRVRSGLCSICRRAGVPGDVLRLIGDLG